MLTIYEAFVADFQSGGLIQSVRENEPAPSNNSGYAELQMGSIDKKPFTLADSDLIEGDFRIVLRYPENSGVTDANLRTGLRCKWTSQN